MSENTESSQKETAFALAALMELPYQYRATQKLQFVKKKIVGGLQKKPFPPPQKVIDHDNSVRSLTHTTNFQSEPTVTKTVPVCPICSKNPKDMAFGCGHTACKECGVTISSCPFCGKSVTTRLRLYT